MSLDECMESVRAFHVAFDQPISSQPTMVPSERVAARAKWMTEEIEEFEQAGSLAEQADAMLDLIYLALGSLVEMGVQAQPLFDIVHAANISKRWPDGSVRPREGGKIAKPPNWADPKDLIEAELEKQQPRSSKG